jgi:hypothetical protein
MWWRLFFTVSFSLHVMGLACASYRLFRVFALPGPTAPRRGESVSPS